MVRHGRHGTFQTVQRTAAADATDAAAVANGEFGVDAVVVIVRLEQRRHFDVDGVVGVVVEAFVKSRRPSSLDANQLGVGDVT